jgi:hypothetical protein
MNKITKSNAYRSTLLLTTMLLVCWGALAQKPTPTSEQKPFAEAHIILQVSDADAVHHTATLDIANNLMKHYGGQDKVDIEIIAFGAGVEMLTGTQNVNTARVASLLDHGVRFYICGNTLDTLERKSGKRSQILPGVEVVQTGVAFMIDEVRRGYLLVHP